MKKLQNNFTTPEQSKRLLELGVPADSADCYMKLNGTDIMLWHQPNRPTMSLFEFISRAKERAGSEVYIPCWSASRLIEIMTICYKWDFLSCASFRIYVTDITSHNVINQLINDLSLEISRGKMDFSKLED